MAGDSIEDGIMSTDAMQAQVPQPLETRTLFPLPEVPASQAAPPAPFGIPRVQRPDRYQRTLRTASLNELLEPDHRARVVWQYVEGLDLQALYERIRAVEGRAGRDPIDPAILLALWLYATLDGVGSARELDRLCEDHVAYQWICGGVSVNYHTLSDFRTAHAEFLEHLLTESVAVLMHEGLVTLDRVAQDGVRVRANAGASSFRRRQTLEECQREAAEQVEALQKELEADSSASTRRREAARRRAAQERSERIGRALEELEGIEAKKKGQRPKKKADGKGPDEKKGPRASTTDPEARVMKMGDGGYRPAQNVQFATDTASQVITGVDVVNVGSDQGQMAPMVEQHRQRYGRAPGEMLVDGGFVKKEDIEEGAAAEPPVVVYAPPPKTKSKDRDVYTPRADDSPPVAAWRQRMGTAEGKAIYKERAATAECVNAIARNRGLQRFLVRGLAKVRAVALWFALAHNLVRAVALRAAAAVQAG